MKEQFELCVNGITKKFKNITVLNGITYSFKRGTTYAITGASGSGKSTLIHILAGLDVPTKGTITFKKRQLNQLSQKERAKSIGLVFQYPYLIKELTVLENIELAGLCIGSSKSESKKRALELLSLVELQKTATWSTGQLSGGQKQRIALARALMNRPSFLFADELTGNLDHDTGLNIITLVLSYCRQWNMGLILSSHNQEISHMMDLVFTLKDGNLVSMDKGSQVSEGRLNEFS